MWITVKDVPDKPDARSEAGSLLNQPGGSLKYANLTNIWEPF